MDTSSVAIKEEEDMNSRREEVIITISDDPSSPKDDESSIESTPVDSGTGAVSISEPVGTLVGPLISQICALGPKDRCTPSQAQSMGRQVLSQIVTHENNKTSLPYELKNSFDIFHRCLAVAYGTFFLNLYTKANAPCLLCHGCKSLYPPGQYIHHACPALPPNIVPCRSRMWRRCLIPLVSSDITETQQKERWKYVLEKFSQSNMGFVRRSRLPLEADTYLLDMPECKRGRFVKPPSDSDQSGTPSKVTSSSASLARPPLIPFSIKTQELEQINADFDDSVSDDSTSQAQLGQEKPAHRAIELVEELLKEIRRLEQELLEVRNDRLNLVTSV
jgi:hypothetical protein